MKLTTFILIISLMQVSAASFGQKVTLKQRGITLEDVILEIRNQTGYDVLIGTNKFQTSQKIDANFQETQLTDVMDKIVKENGLSYTIEGKTVVIREKETPSFLDRVIDRFANIDVRGRILDEQKNPLPGATVKVKGTKQSTTTNDKGEFYLPNVDENAVLTIAYVGYAKSEIKAAENLGDIALSLSDNKLEEVNVTVNTGYQTLSKERSTGSFTQINNELLNRSVSTDILSRLDGVTSGVIFGKRANRANLFSSSQGGDPSISIRGRSTLFANTEPLVVLDNFPYDGDLSNINPNDIESVTILKDAAAASIWGVRAGNGVIVLTSKKGKLNQSAKVSFNTNLTVIDKPNVFSIPQLSSSEYIDYEKYQFDNGAFDVYLQYAPFNVQSRVIDILEKIRNNPIDKDDLTKQLDQLRQVDTRNDYTQYFLRKAVNQQYALNISGGTDKSQYYLSGGYDKNLLSEIAGANSRATLNARNSYKLINDRLELNADIFITKNRSENNPSPYAIIYPYEQLVDKNGNGLAVIRDLRQASKDALSSEGLLDWNYYPYAERLNKEKVSNSIDYRINLSANFKLVPEVLSLVGTYQYQRGTGSLIDNRNKESYETRLLINQFSYSDATGNITYPIPMGDIIHNSDNDYSNNSGRFQLNYTQTFGSHQITALGGSEIKSYNSNNAESILYGYNSSTATNIPVDFFTDFQQRIGYTSPIGNIYGQSYIKDRIFSYYANASYIFKRKYTLSASARKDESNLFGVDANKKGVPLYSFGFAWELNKEEFYHSIFLPYLKLRLTNGYNGNLTKNLSAYTTAAISDAFNRFRLKTQTIINPPNPSLSWERVHIVNIGIDFALKNNTITGAIDFYNKNGRDLIGNSPVAPQTGVVQFTGNTADMVTKGIDLILTSINTRGTIKWTTNFLFNYVKDKITDYKLQTGTNSSYVTQNYTNPIVGKPYSAILAYPWKGLDNKGNPQGLLNGEITEDYTSILNSTNTNNLIYIGTSIPTVFGSLRNNIVYDGWEVSFNILFKMGYYFRRNSFRSTDPGFQQADFNKRWQKPGDELTTNVPSLIYPGDFSRDQFYLGSESLVEKGDHIRLQDIQLAYSFKAGKKIPFNNLKIYGYASNLGIIWRANKLKLDPDYSGNGLYLTPAPKSYAIGITASF